MNNQQQQMDDPRQGYGNGGNHHTIDNTQLNPMINLGNNQQHSSFSHFPQQQQPGNGYIDPQGVQQLTGSHTLDARMPAPFPASILSGTYINTNIIVHQKHIDTSSARTFQKKHSNGGKRQQSQPQGNSHQLQQQQQQTQQNSSGEDRRVPQDGQPSKVVTASGGHMRAGSHDALQGGFMNQQQNNINSIQVTNHHHHNSATGLHTKKKSISQNAGKTLTQNYVGQPMPSNQTSASQSFSLQPHHHHAIGVIGSNMQNAGNYITKSEQQHSFDNAQQQQQNIVTSKTRPISQMGYSGAHGHQKKNTQQLLMQGGQKAQILTIVGSKRQSQQHSNQQPLPGQSTQQPSSTSSQYIIPAKQRNNETQRGSPLKYQ